MSMGHLCANHLEGGAGGYLFLNEELSDVTVVVQTKSQESWRFPVHTLLLSAQSVVFRRMLCSDFLEKTSKQIVIADIKPMIMEQLLRYIYHGKTDLENWHEAIELLRAAHKYQIEPLVDHCAKFLEHVISIDNVCYVYNEASTYSIRTLKEKCLHLILEAGFIVLRCKAFAMLTKESVMDIVKNSSLNVDSELTVFEALLRWAPMECCRSGHQITKTNILRELEPFLQFLCFDDMSDTDKSALPAAVLSCVKPNNRTRVAFSVHDSLLAHAHCLNFQIDQEFTEFIGNSLTCIRFSLDSPLYMIGLNFVVMVTDFPQLFPLMIIRENCGASTNTYSLNLSLASWKEGLLINERKRCEAQIILRQPFPLDAKAVYKLYTIDQSQNVQCPRTQLQNKKIFTASGCVNLSLHAEGLWGIMGLIFI